MTGDLRDRLAALTPAQRALLERKLGVARPAAAQSAAPPADRFEPFAMTPVQQAYWIGRRAEFAFGGVATHAYAEIDCDGLDLSRLTEAWNSLVARHDMLRAVFAPDGTQRVLESVPRYDIAREDGAAARRRMSHQVLDAARWPLFEIRASRLDDERTRLHLSFDALIADMASRRILLREWAALYREPAMALPPLTGTFRDFAQAERHATARDRDHWLSRIDTLPPAPDLPLDPAYDRAQAPVFTRRTASFDAEERRALEAAARDLGVGLNTLLLLGYSDVLRLWSASDGITLNLTLFNRPPDGAMDDVVGDFTALSLLAIDPPGDDDLAVRAARLQARLWDDLDHRSFDGVAVLREIARRRGGVPGALMPVVFTNALTAVPRAENGLGRETYAISQTPQVWIDLMAVDAGDGFALHWNSVDALFPTGLMDEMFAALRRWLAAAASGAPGVGWRDAAAFLLPGVARETQRAANATAGPLPLRLLHQIGSDAAQRFPHRPAVIAAARTLTHRELANEATHLAVRLRAAGVRPNTLVAVVMHRGWEQVVAVRAVLEAGGAYLPIDPDTPPARLRHLLADANSALALTQPSLANQRDWPGGIDVIAVEPTTAPDIAPLEPAQAMGDLAYVIYTSGSSGAPKGVAIDHRGAVNTVEDVSARFAVGPSDRVLGLSALSFDLSVYDIFGVLAAGGAVVLPDPAAARDPAQWSALIGRHGVTLWNTVPALMELLVDHRAADLTPLRLALLSGDTIAPALAAAVKRRAPAMRVVSLGGATEASIWSIAHDISDADTGARSIPYGKPLRNQTLHVFGPGLVARPIWVPGDLYIGGIGLARRYWNDDAKTAASFITHPQTGERLYRTGDRGRYLPDGSIEFLGRSDGQVKLRGFRVELGEVEAALASHPLVRGAAVVAVGETSSQRTLAAYVVPNGALMPDDAMRHLRARLPAHMLPSSIILLDELPLMTNGKVDRRRLPSPAQSGATPLAVDDAHLARVAALVREATHAVIPDVDSSLLDLGLTSVDMIRVVNAIDAALGVRPQIEAFYAAPTIRWLASQRPVPPRQAPATQARFGEPVALPAAALQPRSRHSTRHFTLRPIALPRFNDLLAPLRHRAYGSASGLYPVQAYLHIKRGRIGGLGAGAYRYDQPAHALRPLMGGAPLDRFAFRAHNAPVFDEAAFTVVLVADLDILRLHYGERAVHLATLEAGLITQALELAAQDAGLGACQIGSADDAALRAVFALAPAQHIAHILLGGEPDPHAPAMVQTGEEARLERLLARVRDLAPDETRALLDAPP